VGAASDGKGGAYVAFKENSSNIASMQSFRVQQVTMGGTLPWGASGTSLVSPGTSPQIPFGTPQIVVGTNELAVFLQGWNLNPTGAPVFCFQSTFPSIASISAGNCWERHSRLV
jgi:hypothetical protein